MSGEVIVRSKKVLLCEESSDRESFVWDKLIVGEARPRHWTNSSIALIETDTQSFGDMWTRVQLINKDTAN